MTTQYLRIGGIDESVNLSGYGILPGIVTDIEVRGQYQIEKKRREGISGSDKFGHGYNDAEVTITLEILPPNEWAQVKQIEKAFKNAFGAAGKPKPIRCVNQLLDSRDITTVLFQGFITRQGSEDDSLLCVISFIEYESLARKQDLKLGKPPTVGGPNALPIPAATATYTPPSVADSFAAGSGAGAADATASKLPPMLADLASGGPAAAKRIGIASGGR